MTARRAIAAVVLLVGVPVVAFAIAFLVHDPQPCGGSDCDESSYVALLVAKVASVVVLLAVVVDEVRRLVLRRTTRRQR